MSAPTPPPGRDASPGAAGAGHPTREPRGPDDAPFVWTAYPARQRPAAAAGAVLVIVAFSALAGVLMQSLGWALAAGAFFALALNRFFLPSRFTIDDEGITARYPLRRRRMRWDEAGRFGHGEHGGWLGAAHTPSRLAAFRGLPVLFGDDRDAAVAQIETRLRRAAASPPTARGEPPEEAGGPGERSG